MPVVAGSCRVAGGIVVVVVVVARVAMKSFLHFVDEARHVYG